MRWVDQLTFAVIQLGSVVDLAVEHNMRNGHSVAGQRSGLVRADDRDGAKSFNDFEVGDQNVLLLQLFCHDRERDDKLRQKPLRDVGHNDADAKCNCFNPCEANNERNDQERNPDEDGKDAEHEDEAANLSLHQRLGPVNDSRGACNAAKERVVAGRKHDPDAVPAREVAPRARNVLCLVQLGVQRVGAQLDVNVLSSERRVVDFEVGGADYSEVGGDLFARCHLDNVTRHNLLRSNVLQFPVAKGPYTVGSQRAQLLHDFVRFALLVRREDAGEKSCDEQHNPEDEGLPVRQARNQEDDDAHDGADIHHRLEAFHEREQELDEPVHRLGRGDFVGAVLCQ